MTQKIISIVKKIRTRINGNSRTPGEEDSNKTFSIPRSKYLEKENSMAQLYVIQLCLSNILNLLLFAKKKSKKC